MESVRELLKAEASCRLVGKQLSKFEITSENGKIKKVVAVCKRVKV
ncbi:MAG: hypothetical protein WC595_07060 [Candidatus Nanoarchaeia archaeon]